MAAFAGVAEQLAPWLCRALAQLEQKLAALPWAQAREGVEVKLLAESGELYIYAQSRDRVHKERAMRRRQMRWLRDRLKELARMKPKRDALLMKLGAAHQQAPAAWRLFDITVPDAPRRRQANAKTADCHSWAPCPPRATSTIGS